jgi:hypothetical protein
MSPMWPLIPNILERKQHSYRMPSLNIKRVSHEQLLSRILVFLLLRAESKFQNPRTTPSWESNRQIKQIKQVTIKQN